MVSKFKVTRVWTIGAQSHAELKGDDGFVSLHRPAGDNLTEGQEFILQSVEVAEEVRIWDFNYRRKIKVSAEPEDREENQSKRKDILSDELSDELK
jgi:hypothetical protein